MTSGFYRLSSKKYLMNKVFISLVRKYQKNKKPDHVPTCIFEPSCSQYAIIVLEKYHLFKALYMILNRIYRCDSSKNIGGKDFP